MGLDANTFNDGCIFSSILDDDDSIGDGKSSVNKSSPCTLS